MAPVLLALAAWLLAAPALGHDLPRSYCTVRTVPGGIDVSLETAGHLLAQPLGLPSASPDEALLRASGARFAARALDAVSARTPEGACSPSAEAPLVVEEDGEPSSVVMLHFACPAGPVTLRVAWRLDVDPSSETLCAIDGAAAVFRLGAIDREVGTPPTLARTLADFTLLGVHHVASGLDHVLFVVSLMAAAALATRARAFGSALRAIAAVVTGFTLGHSVTLIGAGLGLLRLEPRLTESVIALSIVYVGVENIIRRELRGRAITAALFGLVHGFGFASILADVELPRRGAVAALVSFNVGVELGQLALVVTLFPLLAWAARRPWYRPRVLVPLSALVTVIAAIWFVERAAGVVLLPALGT
ncbi:MAG: HupE/UreJ family protein [Sorangiineae bacterium]|nr:HupE/UreJ family protein [Sorangiineae bacterium]